MLSIITGRCASKQVLVWLALAGAGLVAASGCDKLPLLAPSLSTISLSSSTSIVQSNGTAEIRATVLESSGTPVQNGTAVTFTTNLGTISPTDARTLNGVATAQFVANGQSGIAEIHATSGSAKSADSTSTTSTSPSITLTVGAAAAGRVQLTASPSRVSSGGNSAITAVVSDTNGNPLNGVAVAFTSDAGSLSSSLATTNSNGQAVTTLTTTKDATVTATTGGTTGTSPISNTVKVTVSSLPDIGIAVAGGSTPVQGQAVTFTVTVTLGNATDSFQSIVVNFGDGVTSPALGGSATSVSHIYNSSGTYTVTATGTAASGESKSGSTIISVAPKVPLSVTFTAASSFTTSTLITFTATVTPNTNISGYAWNFGESGSSTNTVTTTGNITTHQYTTNGIKTIYTVTLAVTTTDGNSGNAQIQIAVQ